MNMSEQDQTEASGRNSARPEELLFAAEKLVYKDFPRSFVADW